MGNKRTLANTLMSLSLQFVTILSGFIIPKLILDTFGSEVNGLVSSLNQFLNYINLFEGGLSAVILSTLYKPLAKKDYEKVSSICVASIRFYRKLACIFLVYTVALGVLYPIITKTEFSFDYIFSLTVILSINMFAQYCFSITFRTLLKADRKVYFVSAIQILIIVLNTLGVAVIIKLYPNIHIVKLLTMFIFLLQPLIFNFYVKKNYPLDLSLSPDLDALKQRWNGFGINLAAFIHNNTDVVVLTIFTDLKTVSVYSVYFLVTTGLKNLITSLSAGIVPTLGHLIAGENLVKINEAFDNYEFLIFYVTSILFTVGGLLITPFVMIYTQGINDTVYYHPVFGGVMILSEAIFCIREPYVNMAYSSGKFKEVSPYAFVEAGINIVLSIILVLNYGLIGVAVATCVSMLFRTIYHMLFLKFNILYRPLKIICKKVFLFGMSIMIIVALSNICFSLGEYTVINWLIYAIQNTILSFFVLTVMCFIFYKEEISLYLKPIRKMMFKKGEQ